MVSYRRISRAAAREELEAFERDLVSAYGELPSVARTLLSLAAVRIGAAELGVRSVTRHEKDVIFRTPRPREIEEVLEGIQGTVRLVGELDAAGLAEIYYRPPASYFESDSLLTVLRRRLCGVTRQTCSDPA